MVSLIMYLEYECHWMWVNEDNIIIIIKCTVDTYLDSHSEGPSVRNTLGVVPESVLDWCLY